MCVWNDRVIGNANWIFITKNIKIIFLNTPDMLIKFIFIYYDLIIFRYNEIYLN